MHPGTRTLRHLRSVFVALFVVGAALSSCGDDDDGGGDVDVSGEDAQAYLADLEAAGLGDLFEDDAEAVAFVETACANAATVGQTPEELIEAGGLNEQSAVALTYCDTDLAG